MEMEMQEPIQVTKGKMTPPPPSSPLNNGELSNEVYVFYDKNQPGFKFYDKTPNPVISKGKLVGVEPKGVYYAYNIEKAEWDEEINKPGQTVSVNYIGGSNKVTTVMVSEKDFLEIITKIIEELEKPRIDGKIRIDLRSKITMKDLVTSGIKIKDEVYLKEIIEKFDKNYNEIPEELRKKYADIDIKEPKE